jgi:hypothetical protein
MIEGVVERGEKTSRGYFFFNENHNCSRNMMECYYIIFCFFSAGCSLGFLFFMCFIALQSNFSRNNIMRIALYAVLKHEARGARAQVRFYKAPSVDRREGSTNLSDYTCKYFSLRKNYCLFLCCCPQCARRSWRRATTGSQGATPTKQRFWHRSTIESSNHVAQFVISM